MSEDNGEAVATAAPPEAQRPFVTVTMTPSPSIATNLADAFLVLAALEAGKAVLLQSLLKPHTSAIQPVPHGLMASLRRMRP